MEPSPLNENGGDSSLQQFISLRPNRLFFPAAPHNVCFAAEMTTFIYIALLGTLEINKPVKDQAGVFFILFANFVNKSKSLSSFL